MGLFGKKKPKLRSYAGDDLESILRDEVWLSAMTQAGVEAQRCELVLRLSACTISDGGSPIEASPAVLLGQGGVLAVAYPTDREVRVTKRDISRGELQTQRSGMFQVLFGPPSNLDGFMFYGPQDGLKAGTDTGEAFGAALGAFMNGQLAPGQVTGTPQSLAANTVHSHPRDAGAQDAGSPESSVSEAGDEDPGDALRHKAPQALYLSLKDVSSKYEACLAQADRVEKGYSMSEAEFVNGVRQQESSRNAFRQHAARGESELGSMLGDLRKATVDAADQWRDLVFLLPGEEGDVMKIANWCMASGVDSEVMSSVVASGVLLHADFGTTRSSFWAENQRLTSAANNAGN